MSERVPVIIAASQEQGYIARALRSLATTKIVSPIVVVNGPRDNTASIAREYGACVIEREEPGKLQAVQEGLRHLWDQNRDAALGPVLFMDADSYLRTKRWPSVLQRNLMQQDGPAVVSGLTIYCDGGKSTMLVRDAKRFTDSVSARRTNQTRATYGYNMGIKMDSPAILDTVMSLPATWPGEDRLIADVVREQDGGGFTQLLSIGSAVVTSARYQNSLMERLRIGKDAQRALIKSDYAERSNGADYAYDGHAETLIPYDSTADILPLPRHIALTV